MTSKSPKSFRKSSTETITWSTTDRRAKRILSRVFVPKRLPEFDLRPMYLYAAKDAPPTARLYRALKRLDLPLSAFGYHCTRNTLNCVLPVCLWTGLPLDYILGTRQSARLCRPIRDIETYPKIKFNLLTGVREAIIDCKNNRLIQMFSERRHKMLHCIYSTRPETRRMGSPNINMLGRWIVVFGLRPDALAGIEWEELR